MPKRESSKGVKQDGVPVSEKTGADGYITSPEAMKLLKASLEELAAWIFLGPDLGGIAAYTNFNELDPPPRFHYHPDLGMDYLDPLMACWFKKSDIIHFEPGDRYITGKQLMERWSTIPGVRPEAFIRAKIAESRLMDIHPIFGRTQGSFSDCANFPPIEDGLFSLSDVCMIETADLSQREEQSGKEIGSPEWRTENARKAANARHNKPGGSRDKAQQMRDIWETGKYTSRDRCAEEECAALDMSFSAARKALRKKHDN